jgi:hypothetical protein
MTTAPVGGAVVVRSPPLGSPDLLVIEGKVSMHGRGTILPLDLDE